MKLEPLPFLKWWIAKGLAYNNELKEACELLNSVSIEASGTVWDRIALFFLHAIQGEKSKALEMVNEDFIIAMKDDAWFAIFYCRFLCIDGS